MEVHRLAQSLIGLWDDQIDNLLLGEAHAEEFELVHIRNLVLLVMDKLAGLIREVGICTTATILGLLPCAGRRCCSLHRRLCILWHRLIVIVDSDPLLVELPDLLPCHSMRQAAFNVCGDILIR